MKRHPRLLIVLGFTTIFTVMLIWMANTIWHRDTRKFQGVWVGNGYRFTVVGDIATLETSRFPKPSAAYYSLDPLASPPRIKIWPSEERYLQSRPSFLGIPLGLPKPLVEDSENHGIYQIDGDRLLISLSPPAGEYPNTFEQTDRYLLLDLRRE